ncbi:MAG: NifB/NifX family molybdenum-iron cluster-binding protein [Odoribacter sp.]
MKVAVPTRDQNIDDHFGHCEYYTIFTIGENKEIIHTERQASPEGCGCKSNIASVLEEKGITLMLAGNMGEGAKNTLETHHISVIRGCAGSVESVVQSWLRGEISDSGEMCSHHDEHHECSHHDAKPLTFKVL